MKNKLGKKNEPNKRQILLFLLLLMKKRGKLLLTLSFQNYIGNFSRLNPLI